MLTIQHLVHIESQLCSVSSFSVPPPWRVGSSWVDRMCEYVSFEGHSFAIFPLGFRNDQHTGAAIFSVKRLTDIIINVEPVPFLPGSVAG